MQKGKMSRRRLIQRTEARCGTPVLVIAASWRSDTATDLDLRAARAVAGLLESTRAEHITIVCAFRGGDVAFADSVIRSLRSRNVLFDVAVPTLVTGAGALLALAANEILIHPHGGVGAHDAGPLTNRHATMSAPLFDDIPALGGIRYEHDPTLPTRLAGGMQQRRLARELASRITESGADFDALSHLRLGDSLGLGATELSAAGFRARTWDDPALWALFRLLEQDLGLLASPPLAYTDSDLADEVEFEPATVTVSAILETRRRALEYQLDTGSPDPETGVCTGSWL